MSKDKNKHTKKEHHKKAEHKKDKPKKEKKQKGIKQKQSQKQKQVVNIKIGGDSGGNNDRSNKMPIPLPMPNITFNPSLSVIPNALLNKPETNPPFYAEQAGGLVGGAVPQIPNFNIPSFEPPIREQPTNINKKPPPISVPPDIITGNTEKIKPPPEVYQPIPQDEVSKPKEQIPELYIGEEKIKTKHDLHKESKTKIKDTEGLGANIPISKIGEIAATIGSGALTGGATMLGEAALTGGLGVITAEGIVSSLIGGGVGAGVSNSLGGGQISNIVGGIAGGIASRTAVKNVRQRQKKEQQNIRETEPLLGGQRLGGGNSGFNRLTGTTTSTNEIQLIPDEKLTSKEKEFTKKLYDEATKTKLKTKQIMEQVKERAQSIKERAKQKMQETNKAITTLGEQITDSYNQYLGDRKGTYSRVPTSSPDDILKRFDADVTNIDEQEQTRKILRDQMYDMTRRDIYDGNDEWDIERTLKEMRAQSKIKTAMKRKLAANKVEKYKKDITEGVEMQHITDTLQAGGLVGGAVPEEEPQPKTVGLFKQPIIPFSGEGRRVSGARKSIGTVRSRQQKDMSEIVKEMRDKTKKEGNTFKTKATPIKTNKSIKKAAQILQNVQPSTDLSTTSRNARHELDKSDTARIQRMTDESTRSEENIKRASTIQAAIRRLQSQQQFRAQQYVATQLGAQTKRILTNKKQIKRFETEISNLDKPAKKETTMQNRRERRQTVETGLNILRRDQIKEATGRPRTRTGNEDDEPKGKKPKKKK